MSGITASIRTPKEVIALVCPEKADEIEAILVKSLESVPGTLIFVRNGSLEWAHCDSE